MICNIWYLVTLFWIDNFMLYKNIYIYIFKESQNTLKRYAEIDQYWNISFHWTNRNGFRNSIHNIGLKLLPIHFLPSFFLWAFLASILARPSHSKPWASSAHFIPQASSVHFLLSYIFHSHWFLLNPLDFPAQLPHPYLSDLLAFMLTLWIY